eukprot:s2488_g12.t1
MAAKALWHEAELMHDKQLFKLFLPHLTVLRETLQHCGFMIGALEDVEGLSDQELDTLQRTAAVFASEVNCCFNDLNIGSSGAKVVAKALKTSGTLELRLNNNDVGDEGAEALAVSLTFNSALQWLFLRANRIGARGAQAMGQGLERNRWLQLLDLHGCNIGNRGAKALATYLTTNGSLRSLNLGANCIHRGAKAMAESLRRNHCLQDLYLQHNEISDLDAQDLANSLTSNRSLLFLDLDANNIGNGGAEALVRDSRRLRHLSIVGNNIGDRGAEAMARSLDRSCLTYLQVSDTLRGTAGGQALQAAEEEVQRNGVRGNRQFQIVWRPVSATSATVVMPLGKKFNIALLNGDMMEATDLWDEAEIVDDIQLFVLVLPHLTFFLDVTKHCGFMSEELNEIETQDLDKLETLLRMAAVFFGQERPEDDRQFRRQGA